MNKIICTDLTKTYGKTKALDGLNLEFGDNKIYGLVGRNGAGKTTLLKAIAAQVIPTSGNISIDGEQIFENQRMLDEICLSRGYTNAVLSARKVRDILNMCRIFYKYWDEDFAKRLMECFQIDQKKAYAQLSSGLQSAVNIIVGLSSRAPFTLLDEPVAGLDVVARDRFYSMLLEDYMQNPRTYVISTHLIEEASSIFEETIFIDKGKVMLSTNTDELRDSYRYVSGKEDLVKSCIAGMQVIHQERSGARLTVCVKLSRKLDVVEGIEIKEVPLQKLFVYFTNEAEGVAVNGNAQSL